MKCCERVGVSVTMISIQPTLGRKSGCSSAGLLFAFNMLMHTHINKHLRMSRNIQSAATNPHTCPCVLYYDNRSVNRTDTVCQCLRKLCVSGCVSKIIIEISLSFWFVNNVEIKKKVSHT